MLVFLPNIRYPFKADLSKHLNIIYHNMIIGILMIVGPYLSMASPGFNDPEDEPEEMGNGMSLCIASGVLAIGVGIVLGILAKKYLNKNTAETGEIYLEDQNMK